MSAGSGGGGVYRHPVGYSPWYDRYGYYRDGGVIVVTDEPVVEATPLPSGLGPISACLWTWIWAWISNLEEIIAGKLKSNSRLTPL